MFIRKEKLSQEQIRRKALVEAGIHPETWGKQMPTIVQRNRKKEMKLGKVKHKNRKQFYDGPASGNRHRLFH